MGKVADQMLYDVVGSMTLNTDLMQQINAIDSQCDNMTMYNQSLPQMQELILPVFDRVRQEYEDRVGVATRSRSRSPPLPRGLNIAQALRWATKEELLTEVLSRMR